MIEISPALSIDENDIQYDFIRSSGPGGQNVNKVSSGVQLRFDVNASTTLPEEVKLRLYSIARNRITEEGILIIEAKRFRTQEQNRQDATNRLVALIFQATEKPKQRRRTRPSLASQVERIEEKKRRSAIKQSRRMARNDTD
jgi:ribosome-associated protein